MALPTLPRRRSRRDSHAQAVAARTAAQGTPSVARIRAPRGATVGQYLIPGSPPSWNGGNPRNGVGPQVVTAAAQVIYGGTGGTAGQTVKRTPTQPWQEEAWTLRREIGEFRFSGDRVARAVSQCRLYIARVPDKADAQPEPVTEGPIYELGRQLFGNRALVQQEMKRAGQHLVFNGETLFLVRQDPDTKRLSWSSQSVPEITGQGENMKLDDGLQKTELGPSDIVVRCWSPDPEKGAFADCAARSVLPVARELKGLTEHTSAQIDSRLAGAGLLVVPDTIEVLAGQVSSPEEGDEDGDMDEFVRALVESMTVPLSKRDSAAAIVPLVAKVPESVVDKINHITFASAFDAMAKDLREENIRRMGLGMDSDPAVLLGMGGGNHWTAWLISEDENTLVVSPCAATIAHAFTVGLIRPVLEQIAPGEDPNQYMVWFDSSELTLRPDKSADARTLGESGLLSDAAILIANGFDPDSDAPTADEIERRLLIKLMLAKPDFAPQILPYLGIDLDLTGTAAPADVAAPVEPGPPADDSTDGQDREIPDTMGDPPPVTQEPVGAPA